MSKVWVWGRGRANFIRSLYDIKPQDRILPGFRSIQLICLDICTRAYEIIPSAVLLKAATASPSFSCKFIVFTLQCEVVGGTEARRL